MRDPFSDDDSYLDENDIEEYMIACNNECFTVNKPQFLCLKKMAKGLAFSEGLGEVDYEIEGVIRVNGKLERYFWVPTTKKLYKGFFEVLQKLRKGVPYRSSYGKGDGPAIDTFSDKALKELVKCKEWLIDYYKPKEDVHVYDNYNSPFCIENENIFVIGIVKQEKYREVIKAISKLTEEPGIVYNY